ncbi:MAG: thiamine phosphate synthase [Candidatus Aminicenantes bacterium]|nr:thiamine phosphate synthase [Candidatus Aminicenantes bacterium]
MKTIDWRLCLVADSEAAGNRNLISIIREAVDAGVTLVQLRGKNLEIRAFLNLAVQASEFLKSRNIPLIINDRIDVALACEADGVHLGQEDLPLPIARKIMRKERLIGISVNTIKEAEESEAEGADYIGVGPIFYTSSKEDLRSILGFEGLKAIRNKVKIPILAIGGINAENAGDVIVSGADGIAVISAIMDAKNITEATRNLLEAIRTLT